MKLFAVVRSMQADSCVKATYAYSFAKVSMLWPSYFSSDWEILRLSILLIELNPIPCIWKFGVLYQSCYGSYGYCCAVTRPSWAKFSALWCRAAYETDLSMA